MAKKTNPFIVSSTKNTKPKTKKFFSVQTRRHTESFGGMDSFPAQSPGKLWSCKVAPN